jgi:hypothetical protein
MSGYSASIESLCYRGGAAGEAVVGFAFYLPIAIFLGLNGYGFFSGAIYVLLLSTSFWLSFLGSVVLQAIIAHGVPHPSCNSSTWGNPSFETQLIYHYVGMLLVHRLYWKLRIGVLAVVRAASFCVLLPILYVWSGNNTIPSVVFGALAGLLIGLLSTVSIYLFWLPRIWVLAENPILRWIGYTLEYSPPPAPAPTLSRNKKVARDIYLEPPPSETAMQRFALRVNDILL